MASVIRYGSSRLFSSVETSPSVLRSITLVNDVEFGFSVNRTRVKSIGYNKILSRSLTSSNPVVSFSYYLSDLDNEELFSLNTTSSKSIISKRPLFEDPQPVDLAFVTDEKGRDFKSLKVSDHPDVNICLITNCYIQSYSFNLDSTGLIIVSVTFSGDDILFKTFKNLSGYSVLEIDSEDNELTNQNAFLINDGIEELTSNIGGGYVGQKIKSFGFQANLPYKTLFDFGQTFHRKKINHPFETNISMTAFVDSFFEGKLSNIFCNDKTNDFIITNKRLECGGVSFNEKSGMVFKGAELTSEKYKKGIGSFLEAELTFSLYTSKTCGVYFSQHVQSSELLAGENSSVIKKHIIGGF